MIVMKKNLIFFLFFFVWGYIRWGWDVKLVATRDIIY